uniref:Uncharacterized protein n=1 Tax=Vespula pensylvanica TaxID=30213 RepID=A0A834PBD9_VESPE|nr:hypothetical protein H0235_002650 [Vespula pensylvanica]
MSLKDIPDGTRRTTMTTIDDDNDNDDNDDNNDDNDDDIETATVNFEIEERVVRRDDGERKKMLKDGRLICKLLLWTRILNYRQWCATQEERTTTVIKVSGVVINERSTFSFEATRRLVETVTSSARVTSREIRSKDAGIISVTRIKLIDSTPRIITAINNVQRL